MVSAAGEQAATEVCQVACHTRVIPAAIETPEFGSALVIPAAIETPEFGSALVIPAAIETPDLTQSLAISGQQSQVNDLKHITSSSVLPSLSSAIMPLFSKSTFLEGCGYKASFSVKIKVYSLMLSVSFLRVILTFDKKIRII